MVHQRDVVFIDVLAQLVLEFLDQTSNSDDRRVTGGQKADKPKAKVPKHIEMPQQSTFIGAFALGSSACWPPVTRLSSEWEV